MPQLAVAVAVWRYPPVPHPALAHGMADMTIAKTADHKQRQLIISRSILVFSDGKRVKGGNEVAKQRLAQQQQHMVTHRAQTFENHVAKVAYLLLCGTSSWALSVTAYSKYAMYLGVWGCAHH